MSEREQIGPLMSKREKALAVPRLKQAIKEALNISDKKAQKKAIHEFRHAVQDDKPGYYSGPLKKEHIVGAEWWKPHRIDTVAYEPIGERSRDEELKILKGPGKDMSILDLIEQELFFEDSAFVEKFTRKILKLLVKP